jgi:hypothetical protein
MFFDEAREYFLQSLREERSASLKNMDTGETYTAGSLITL